MSRNLLPLKIMRLLSVKKKENLVSALNNILKMRMVF